MRIAQIAPLAERVPPHRYGGTERIVHALTEELVRRGHSVTLFASGDSLTSAELVSVYPVSLREARVKDLYGLNIWTLLNIGLVYERQDAFDIIHDHNGYIGLPIANIAKTPTVITTHGPFTAENRRIFQMLHKPYIVTLSNAQMIPAPGIHYAGTVYNGLPMLEYPFSLENDGYLLYVGRICMDKGTHYAIEVARALRLPLVIAAKLEPTDRPYFHEHVEPFLSEQIRWVGEVTEEERNRLMSRALCFLHPVTWREPFGLTLIEAMACGCPVVAFNHGSSGEVVVHGKTGFVVRDSEEMIEAVINIDKINRADCREHAIKNFSVEKMTDNYESIYTKILEENKIPADSLFYKR
ncbi:MAG: hypothetical protein A2754_03320 [Candidatus Magasanikbacteria bacterium RIFCSPHIGHO2_01_FULL_47_8]|uniref:Glycosyl transferase n=1 Tax=Candidatus Magasanikbacteria bacterium RIFCSPHIGHO2_01_FULL_47_8 TaxID=1798673 RepID=A0A1F6MB58_9BACT|nr:MAG: hypothetical protein A2754_03320 [Candidatus Magasanikbacteria bacterium RIFCSPHIGHO2_01_FULL_47_8]